MDVGEDIISDKSCSNNILENIKKTLKEYRGQNIGNKPICNLSNIPAECSNTRQNRAESNLNELSKKDLDEKVKFLASNVRRNLFGNRRYKKTSVVNKYMRNKLEVKKNEMVSLKVAAAVKKIVQRSRLEKGFSVRSLLHKTMPCSLQKMSPTSNLSYSSLASSNSIIPRRPQSVITSGSSDLRDPDTSSRSSSKFPYYYNKDISEVLGIDIPAQFGRTPIYSSPLLGEKFSSQCIDSGALKLSENSNSFYLSDEETGNLNVNHCTRIRALSTFSVLDLGVPEVGKDRCTYLRDQAEDALQFHNLNMDSNHFESLSSTSVQDNIF